MPELIDLLSSDSDDDEHEEEEEEDVGVVKQRQQHDNQKKDVVHNNHRSEGHDGRHHQQQPQQQLQDDRPFPNKKASRVAAAAEVLHSNNNSNNSHSHYDVMNPMMEDPQFADAPFEAPSTNDSNYSTNSQKSSPESNRSTTTSSSSSGSSISTSAEDEIIRMESKSKSKQAGEETQETIGPTNSRSQTARKRPADFEEQPSHYSSASWNNNNNNKKKQRNTPQPIAFLGQRCGKADLPNQRERQFPAATADGSRGRDAISHSSSSETANKKKANTGDESRLSYSSFTDMLLNASSSSNSGNNNSSSSSSSKSKRSRKNNRSFQRSAAGQKKSPPQSQYHQQQSQHSSQNKLKQPPPPPPQKKPPPMASPVAPSQHSQRPNYKHDNNYGVRTNAMGQMYQNATMMMRQKPPPRPDPTVFTASITQQRVASSATARSNSAAATATTINTDHSKDTDSEDGELSSSSRRHSLKPKALSKAAAAAAAVASKKSPVVASQHSMASSYGGNKCNEKPSDLAMMKEPHHDVQNDNDDSDNDSSSSEEEEEEPMTHLSSGQRKLVGQFFDTTDNCLELVQILQTTPGINALLHFWDKKKKKQQKKDNDGRRRRKTQSRPTKRSNNKNNHQNNMNEEKAENPNTIDRSSFITSCGGTMAAVAMNNSNNDNCPPDMNTTMRRDDNDTTNDDEAKFLLSNSSSCGGKHPDSDDSSVDSDSSSDDDYEEPEIKRTSREAHLAASDGAVGPSQARGGGITGGERKEEDGVSDAEDTNNADTSSQTEQKHNENYMRVRIGNDVALVPKPSDAIYQRVRALEESKRGVHQNYLEEDLEFCCAQCHCNVPFPGLDEDVLWSSDVTLHRRCCHGFAEPEREVLFRDDPWVSSGEKYFVHGCQKVKIKRDPLKYYREGAYNKAAQAEKQARIDDANDQLKSPFEISLTSIIHERNKELYNETICDPKFRKKVGGITVIDFFAGHGTGRVALQKNGIRVKKYIVVEYDPVALHVFKMNHDIRYCQKIGVNYVGKPADGETEFIYIERFEDFDLVKMLKDHGPIDLVIGSPECQDYSAVNASGEGTTGKGGSYHVQLGHMIRKICGHAEENGQHCYFVVENVIPKNFEDQRTLENVYGTPAVKVDARYFSPQRRRRTFHTNLPLFHKFDNACQLIGAKSCLEDGYVLPGDLLYSDDVGGCKVCCFMASRGRINNRKRMKVVHKAMFTWVDKYKPNNTDQLPDEFRDVTFVRFINVVERCRMMGYHDTYVTEPLKFLFSHLEKAYCGGRMADFDWKTELPEALHCFSGIGKVTEKKYEFQLATPQTGVRKVFFNEEEYGKHLVGNAYSVPVMVTFLSPLTKVFETDSKYKGVEYEYYWTKSWRDV